MCSVVAMISHVRAREAVAFDKTTGIIIKSLAKGLGCGEGCGRSTVQEQD